MTEIICSANDERSSINLLDICTERAVEVRNISQEAQDELWKALLKDLWRWQVFYFDWETGTRRTLEYLGGQE